MKKEKGRSHERPVFFFLVQGGTVAISVAYSPPIRRLFVDHADGIFGASVDAGLAIDALFGIYPSLAIDHGDDFGGAGFHTFFTRGAQVLVD
jgi:hypothetical protein